MKNCKNCKSLGMNLIDSSENSTYSSQEFKDQCAVWEEWECEDCGALFIIEDGHITERCYGNG